MGTLRVDYSNNDMAYSGLWARAGNQGNTWTSVSLDIPLGGFNTKVKIILINVFEIFKKKQKNFGLIYEQCI